MSPDPQPIESKKKHRRKPKRKLDENIHVESKVEDVSNEKDNEPIKIDQAEDMIHFGLVNADKKAYFKGLEKIFKEKFDEYKNNPDECESFLKAAYNEIDGYELRLSADLDCSRVLEDILQLSDQFYIRVFLDRLAGSFFDMSTHRFASHVVQCLLNIIAKFTADKDANTEIANGNDSEESLLPITKMFVLICEELMPRMEEMMVNPYGSHVLRSILLLTSSTHGERLRLIRSSKSQEYKAKHEIVTTDEVPENYQPIPEYRQIYVSLIDRLVLSMTPTLLRLFSTHKVANPVLQMVIKICALEDSQHADELVERILLVHGPADESFFHAICKDPVGSHLIQTGFQYASDRVIHEVSQRYFSTEFIRILAMDKIGNYLLQTFLSKSSTEGDVKKCFDALKDQMNNLLFRGRINVVVKMMDACSRLGCCLDEMTKRLKECFKIIDGISNKDLLALFRLSLDPSKEFSSGGSSLVVAFAQLPSPYSDPILTVLLELDTSDLCLLALNQTTSVAFENILSSSRVSFKFKRYLIKRLTPLLSKLALSQCGSRVVDKCWEQSDISQKELMCKALVQSKEELSANYFGRLILRNCAVVEFQRNKPEWTRRNKRYKVKE